MVHRRSFVKRAALAAGVLMAACLMAALPAAAKPDKAPTEPRVVVYVLRGLMNVFSTGMNSLAASLEGRPGVKIVLGNHANWPNYADEAARIYKESNGRTKIVVVGHSLGADAILPMAMRMQRAGAPIELAVTFDPVHPRPVPGNVRRLVNLFQSNNFWGNKLDAAAGSRGEVENIDLASERGMNHFNIDNSEELHARVAKMVDEVARQKTAKRPPAKKPLPQPAPSPDETAAKQATAPAPVKR